MGIRKKHKVTGEHTFTFMSLMTLQPLPLPQDLLPEEDIIFKVNVRREIVIKFLELP